MRSFHIFSFPEPLYFTVIANAMPVQFSRKTVEISADLQAETIDGNFCVRKKYPA
jgi:hypothetical protein